MGVLAALVWGLSIAHSAYKTPRACRAASRDLSDRFVLFLHVYCGVNSAQLVRVLVCWYSFVLGTVGVRFLAGE